MNEEHIYLWIITTGFTSGGGARVQQDVLLMMPLGKQHDAPYMLSATTESATNQQLINNLD